MKILEISKTSLGFPQLTVEVSEDGTVHLPTILVALGWFESKAEAARVIKAGSLKIGPRQDA